MKYSSVILQEKLMKVKRNDTQPLSCYGRSTFFFIYFVTYALLVCHSIGINTNL